jgi:hypothetical protein
MISLPLGTPRSSKRGSCGSRNTGTLLKRSRSLFRTISVRVQACGACSTRSAAAAAATVTEIKRESPTHAGLSKAGATGLEPATSGVTGQFDGRPRGDQGRAIALSVRLLVLWRSSTIPLRRADFDRLLPRCCPTLKAHVRARARTCEGDCADCSGRSTLSLPCAAKRLPWVATGCRSVCLSRFRSGAIRDWVPVVAPAWLYKRSIPVVVVSGRFHGPMFRSSSRSPGTARAVDRLPLPSSGVPSGQLALIAASTTSAIVSSAIRPRSAPARRARRAM